MLGLKQLDKVKLLLHQHLSILLKTINFEPKLARIHVMWRDNIQIFIRYNNYGEYSYSIIFSKAELDRSRYDNYFDRWDVISRPHHFHPRKKSDGVSSKMTVNPDNDIPFLCKLIKSGKIYEID